MGVRKRRMEEQRRRRRILITLIAVPLAAVLAFAAVYFLTRDTPPAAKGPVAGPSPSTLEGLDGAFGFTVSSAKCGFDNVISADARIAAEGQFCEVAVAVENNLSEPVTLDPECQYLIGTSRQRYPAHDEATRVAAGDEPFDDGVGAGSTTDIAFQFDIPDAEGATGVELHGTCDSEGVRLGLPASES